MRWKDPPKKGRSEEKGKKKVLLASEGKCLFMKYQEKTRELSG